MLYSMFSFDPVYHETIPIDVPTRMCASLIVPGWLWLMSPHHLHRDSYVSSEVRPAKDITTNWTLSVSI